MSQLTIYLEDSLEAKVREKAKNAGMSVSKWIATTIERNDNEHWPADVLASFGTWEDVPETEELRKNLGADIPREELD
jgi:hypothetical protein